MSIKQNIEIVRKNIFKAAQKSGRNVDDITLIAVTKTYGVNMIKEALACGIKDIGENRVQEITEKLPFIPDEINLHMIGQLQSNKVKYIIRECSLIHSLDRLSLAKEIEKQAAKHNLVANVLIQINQTNNDERGGISFEELDDAVGIISEYEHIVVRGLMCVAPITKNESELRAVFSKMKRTFDDLKRHKTKNLMPDILSMGMSSDYETAVEEGATHVRVGSAIFGQRLGGKV